MGSRRGSIGGSRRESRWGPEVVQMGSKGGPLGGPDWGGVVHVLYRPQNSQRSASKVACSLPFGFFDVCRLI